MQGQVPILAWVLTAYIFVLAGVSVYLVCKLWPPSEQLNEEERPFVIFARPISLPRETHILFIVLLMGLIGGCAYDLWNLANNVIELGSAKPATRAFKNVQAIWYVLRPWTSCLLSFIFYGFVRSGLYVVSVGSGKNINVYGMAGLAGAAGFMANEVYDKLATFIK